MPSSTPKLIALKTAELVKASNAVREAQEALHLLICKQQIAILTATDFGGKPKYSNDTYRTAQLAVVQSEDKKYQEQKKKVQALEDTKARAAWELEELRGEFKLQLLSQQDTVATKYLQSDLAALKGTQLRPVTTA